MSFWIVLSSLTPELHFEPLSAGGAKTRSTGSGRLLYAFCLGFLRRRVARSLVFVALLFQLFLILLKLLDLTIQLFPFAFESLQLLSQGFELPLGALFDLPAWLPLLLRFHGLFHLSRCSFGLVNRPRRFAFGPFLDFLNLFRIYHLFP